VFVGILQGGISTVGARIPAVTSLVIRLTSFHLDFVTGIALITLLFMMLQTEHERCDRVRAGWIEVRRATFEAATAIDEYRKKGGQPDAGKYYDDAQKAFKRLAANILLYGKGSLQKKYKSALSSNLATNPNDPNSLIPIFREMERQAERKCDRMKLRWL
jgi:hypothetical protein